MAIGVYYFKFPNNFTFGGVTGAAVVFAKITQLSASMFSTIVNLSLIHIWARRYMSLSFKTLHYKEELHKEEKRNSISKDRNLLCFSCKDLEYLSLIHI